MSSKSFPQFEAIVVYSFSFKQIIWIADVIAFAIIVGNSNSLRIEHITDLVANKVIDRLDVKLGGESFLYAVNDAQLSRALFRFLKQAIGLIKQPCIFQRYTHAVGQCFQQADI